MPGRVHDHLMILIVQLILKKKNKKLENIALLKGLSGRVDLNKSVFINHFSYERQVSLGLITLIKY